MILSSILDLFPLDANSSFPGVIAKDDSKYGQMFPGGQNHPVQTTNMDG